MQKIEAPTNYFYMNSKTFLERATPYAIELYNSGEREIEGFYDDDAPIEPKRVVHIIDEDIEDGVFIYLPARKEDMGNGKFVNGKHPVLDKKE